MASVTGLLQAVLAAQTAAGLGMAFLVREQREKSRSARPLLWILGVITAWQVSHILLIALPTLELKAFFYLMSTSMELLVTVPWFVFAATFTGRDYLLDARYVGPILAAVAVVLAVEWTTPVHGLYFTDLALNAEGALVSVRGPAYWLGAVVGYTLIAAAMALLTERFLTSRTYRRPVGLLMVGVAAAGAASLVQLSGLVPEVRYHPTVYLTFLTPLTWYVAIFHMGALDVLPLARDRVLTEMKEGVLVVDAAGEVVDANPAAASVLGGDPVGRPAGEVLSPAADPAGLLVEEPVSREARLDDDHHIEVLASPVRERAGDAVAGHLVLLRDITALKRRELELAARTEELERRNEQLDRFASVVSHDLRNPLTVAGGYLELARESGDEAALEKVAGAHERMDDIIENVLELARGGREVTDPEPVDLGRVARTAWGSVETGEATLRAAPDASVVADGSRLRRVFENLFRNAVEHGGEDVTVTVGTTPDGFSVADDGPGIPEEDRDAVFDADYTTGGTGLGLSIVREAAAAHGWTVRATESASGGARFEFTGVEFE